MWLDLEAGILEEFVSADRWSSHGELRASLRARFETEIGIVRTTERGPDGLTDRKRESHALMSQMMRERWARRRR